MKVLGCTALLCLVLGIPTARAQVTPWIHVSGSYSRYAMTNFNANAPTFDASIYGINTGKLTGGIGFDGGVGVELVNRYSVGVGYASLSGSLEKEDMNYGLTYKIPGKAIYGLVEMVFARNDRSLIAIGAGLGKLTSESVWTVTQPGLVPNTDKLNGKGRFAEVYLSGTRWMGPQFGVFGSVGYRRAKVEELKNPDTGLVWIWSSDLSKIQYDFSGPYASLGVTMNLRK